MGTPSNSRCFFPSRKRHVGKHEEWIYSLIGGVNLRSAGCAAEMPEVLYHYTSVEAFLKILKGRRVLFNRLDRVLDLTEGRSSDLGPLGLYQFVSCWTECAVESLQLWAFYPSGMSGVRIALPSDMFETHEQVSHRFRGLHIEPGLRHVLPFDDRIRNDFLVSPLPPEFPHQMIYTDDEEFLTPEVAEQPDTVEFGKLGVHKASDWAFEQEWRFRLFVMPHPIPPDGDFGNRSFAETVGQRFWEIFNSRRVQDTHLFCSLRGAPFARMAVVLGPCVSVEGHQTVEQAVEQWNPTCGLSASQYTGQIRCD
jgi:hypothetical protein